MRADVGRYGQREVRHLTWALHAQEPGNPLEQNQLHLYRKHKAKLEMSKQNS